MKNNYKALILISATTAIAFLAVKISHFSKDGELKVHLRNEINLARKKAYLLALRPSPKLREACQAQVDRIGDKSLLDAEEVKSRIALELSKQDTHLEPLFLELGMMKKGRHYIKASESLLKQAIHPKLSHRGFARLTRTDGDVIYCLAMAGPEVGPKRTSE